MFKSPFSFDGRIRRTEYGLSFIIYFAYCLLLFGIVVNINVPVLGQILALPVIYFMIAQGAKRCHDLGNSGWYLLIPFYVFWMLFADGEVGENEYGPNPKGIGNTNEVEQIGAHL
jgi:uncharacterized membrane protein YhaH (DUF805 family)